MYKNIKTFNKKYLTVSFSDVAFEKYTTTYFSSQ